MLEAVPEFWVAPEVVGKSMAIFDIENGRFGEPYISKIMDRSMGCIAVPLPLGLHQICYGCDRVSGSSSLLKQSGQRHP